MTRILLLAFCVSMLGFVSVVSAQDVAGTYVAAGQPNVRLEIRAGANGALEGTLVGNGLSMPLRAELTAGGFVGTIEADGERIALAGQPTGTDLMLQLGAPPEAAVVLFVRAGDAAVKAPADPAAVVVNGAVLSADDQTRIAQMYAIVIPAGNFWYDPVLGAWGPVGGPTMGFIAPGIEVGGPLAPDASGRGTSIFVNGRELHLYDVIALQQVTGPIIPGRYFITASGLAGFEGGPPLWNLAALAAQVGGGGSNTWQSQVTGASGFSDGTTGAVFLPNGGIVSTGN